MSGKSFNPIPQLSAELSLSAHSVAAVVKLLDDGNTIPFISRYRKEATGNLDEVQIRDIQERLAYITELEDRRQSILDSIMSQGKLSDDLKDQIMACTIKTALEDLYLPYKPKRRTRAAIAREKGLEPLAMIILKQPAKGSPDSEAQAFINAELGVNDADDALCGARDIIAEIVAENAEIRAFVRQAYAKNGLVISKVVDSQSKAPTKFEQYYDFKERVVTIPSHRYLAIRRGENEGVLSFSIEIEPESVLPEIKHLMQVMAASPFASQLEQAIEDAYKRLISPSVETDVRVELKMQSDRSAVDVFADNLRHLLLASPLGGRCVIGVDPGIRTGCKCVAIDETGKYLDNLTIYPGQGERQTEQARSLLLAFILKHCPFAIAVGNGTAGRETEAFVRKLLAAHQLKDTIVVSVSESGASVYSASDIAREEFPELDVTIRGAISIARRLQDPLAELVKVDPKAIGVGQYQHDVHQPLLHDKLQEVVESCVNHVGVEINTASAPLLANVAGIGKSLAIKIIKHREQKGAFKSRKQLLDVTGLGPRTYEQAAGFLRVREGTNPLDASGVHPERYELIEHIVNDMNVSLQDLIANDHLISKIDIKSYMTDSIGEPTLRDIMDELRKPGRDPRTTFERPSFRDDIMSIKDLQVGMTLDGVVTNVTAFGAFVDIGVHQDGLVHISELTDRFIKDPSEVVQVGDKIKVAVLTVEADRNRISLTARMGKKNQNQAPQPPKGKGKVKEKFQGNPFAAL